MNKKELMERVSPLLEKYYSKEIDEWDSAVPMKPDGSYPHDGQAVTVYYKDRTVMIHSLSFLLGLLKEHESDLAHRCSNCHDNKEFFMYYNLNKACLILTCSNCLSQDKMPIGK